MHTHADWPDEPSVLETQKKHIKQWLFAHNILLVNCLVPGQDVSQWYKLFTSCSKQHRNMYTHQKANKQANKQAKHCGPKNETACNSQSLCIFNQNYMHILLWLGIGTTNQPTLQDYRRALMTHNNGITEKSAHINVKITCLKI